MNEVSEPIKFKAVPPKLLGLRKCGCNVLKPMDGSLNASSWCTMVGENLELYNKVIDCLL